MLFAEGVFLFPVEMDPDALQEDEKWAQIFLSLRDNHAWLYDSLSQRRVRTQFIPHLICCVCPLLIPGA